MQNNNIRPAGLLFLLAIMASAFFSSPARANQAREANQATANATVKALAVEHPGAAPLRLAIARLTHGHAAWIFSNKRTDEVTVAAIYEPNQELARHFQEQYDLPAAIFFTNLDSMLDAVKPEAVAAFGSIHEHLEVVAACAPRGIHVMVEKPLATNTEQARKMAELARTNDIQLLTNYETSWYPTTAKTYQLLTDSNFVGQLRKVVVNAGHQGPEEIGVGPEFLEWLTDPVLNGGGALIDFGCYGANLMTYLMQGVRPVSVTAVTRQYERERYPKVDDDATIIIDYPETQCIVQASWNWPFNRKDMAVYGEEGYIITRNDREMRVKNEASPERSLQVQADALSVYENPFNYLAHVIRGKVKPEPNGLYSLETNLTVVRILEAARQSAETGKTVYLRD